MDGLIAYALAKKYTDEHGGGGGGGTHTGTTAPDASIVANVGDFYYNTTNGDLYVCSEYISPTVTITDLTGYTFTFNNSIPFETLNAIRNTYNINSQFPASSYPTWNQTKINIDYYNGMTGIIVINFNGQSNVTAYKSNNNPQWVSQYQKIKFTGGTDATNSTFVNFVLNNATLDGVGSTWEHIYTLPVPTSMSDDKLIQYNGEWTPVSKAYPSTGYIIDRHPNNPSNNYNRSFPGNSYTIYNNGWESIRMDSSNQDIIWTAASNAQSMRRHALKTYLGNPDSGLGARIVNNTDLNTWQTCQGGSYGHISESVAATLTNCPTTTGFVLVSIVLNLGYYYNNPTAASVKSSTVLRYILADDGNIYKQAVIVDNSWNYTWGSWERLITTKEVPNAPTTDGNYVLKCSVSNGTPTYTWVQET